MLSDLSLTWIQGGNLYHSYAVRKQLKSALPTLKTLFLETRLSHELNFCLGPQEILELRSSDQPWQSLAINNPWIHPNMLDRETLNVIFTNRVYPIITHHPDLSTGHLSDMSLLNQTQSRHMTLPFLQAQFHVHVDVIRLYLSSNPTRRLSDYAQHYPHTGYIRAYTFDGIDESQDYDVRLTRWRDSAFAYKFHRSLTWHAMIRYELFV